MRCDRKRKGLLYAGTNRSVYVSFDDGERWQRLQHGFPTTWVRDLLAHHDDLIAATQGRGIWVLDDVSALRAIAAGATRANAALVPPAPAVRLRTSENRDTPPPPETPLGQNPPTGAVFDYWLAAEARGPVTLTVIDETGQLVRRFRSDDPAESLKTDVYFEKVWLRPPSSLTRTAGMHRFVWDLRYPRPAARSFRLSIAAVLRDGTPAQPLGPFVLPGRYTVTLEVDGKRQSQPLEVRLNPRVSVSPEGLAVPSTKGNTSLTGVIGSLVDIAIGVQAADTAPAQGLRDAFAECDAFVDALITRWHRLEPLLRESSAVRPNRP